MGGKIDEEFRATLATLEADAKRAGLSMREVASRASTSTATPFRWKRKTPITIKTMRRMQDVVEIELAQQAPKKPV